MITPEQIDFYHQQGYLLVEGLLPKDEAASYRQEVHDIAERLSRKINIDATWGAARTMVAEAERTQILHCHNIQYYSAAFGRLLLDDRFTSVAAALIGNENVKLHHNKMFIKPPEKGSPFPLHQDYPFFPYKNGTMMAAIFHFDDAPLEKGCVRVVPGSHLKGPLPHIAEGGHHLPWEEYPLEMSVPCPAKAGDVLFFSYTLVHGSGVNVSNEARTTWLVQYYEAGDQVADAQEAERGNGVMLRGIDPNPDRDF
ncbi:MAG: phytanoyl-CoA dioxygenase family protein [Chloroflexi bacterium]|nr:phytanoyl-CoA dioxygenase family protein [Chloroflexota bacterium]OJV86830.1 MAG: phytanoyl-CoA dioxygenase [Chloroflexi bacterium 54-19]